MSIEQFVLKIKRAESPFYARLKAAVKTAKHFNVPIAQPLRPVLAALFRVHWAVKGTWNYIATVFYRTPLFSSRCETVGKGLYVGRMPFITGNVQITLGDDVTVSGALGVAAGRTFDQPRLVIGNRVFLGHNVTFSVTKEIIVEEGAAIANSCFISDNDGHPSSLERRLMHAPVPPEEVKPVHICQNAWIGRSSFIMKGVTIGEGAIVGVGSVVLSDIPPFAIAIGAPARIVQRRQ